MYIIILLLSSISQHNKICFCIHKVIHVGMRSSTSEDVRDIADILKQQLYLDHSSAFHLHISASKLFVDNISTLLATWELDRGEFLQMCSNQ